ncbi:hypothetical protein B0T17DRAFT_491912 [Bombardia bombarda]|uniref:Protein kinase domain-containing protein n=1 Tax=Bombardia bombarda TaxID=252184 RepID=A0AA40C5K4_9PEZI|nr:hypothetical protein B0T17DRAFT_491912 [Bombardia bombarda]
MPPPEDSDAVVQFTRSRDAPGEYPLNVVRTESFGHSLKSFKKRLTDPNQFESSYRALYIRDLPDNKDAFEKAAKLETVEQVDSKLAKTAMDPWWRFVFLHTQTSRDPLGCSQEQLTLLLTHLQVMPSFSELVFNFRKRDRPLTHAIFRHENYLEDNSPSLRLPHLGRSGIQIQHAFNLLTVEKEPEHTNPWPLRHATLYHSFDVETGRFVCILIKGNRELTTRIIDAPERSRHLRPDSPRTRERSFAASLQVHLIMLEWCSENWSEYIADMEDFLSRRSLQAKVAPVAAIASPVPLAEGISRRGTTRTVPSISRQSTFAQSSHQQQQQQQQDGTVSPPTGPIGGAPGMNPRRISSRTLSGFLRRQSGLERRQSNLSQQSNTMWEELNSPLSKLEELESRFDFGELQALNIIGDEIDKSIVALEQNKEVVVQVREQYETATTSHAFTTLMDQAQCKGEIATFFRRVRTIERELEGHRQRLLAMVRGIDHDQQLFEALNQHTSIQSSKAFSLLAQTSTTEMMKWTEKMHHIAIKTKQETLSMHVITVFTLIFLPGTFLATFFSSGVLNWDDDGKLGSEWVIRQQGLRLFLMICLPMMVVIIAGWALLYWYGRQRTNKHKLELQLERGLGLGSDGNVNGMGEKGGMGNQQRLSVVGEEMGLGIAPKMALANPEPFTKFFTFVAKTKKAHIGRDLDGNEHYYIPYSKLRDYWQVSRINLALSAVPNPRPIDAEVIRKYYLRTFSTLVYTGPNALSNLPTHFIPRNLSDVKLPLSKQPVEWPDTPFLNDLFNSFCDNQWLFFPLCFTKKLLQDNPLDPRHILPIDPPETIVKGHIASILRITIHDDYNGLLYRNEEMPKDRTFVFKVYHKSEGTYERELGALKSLSVRQPPVPNVVKFYGAFRQQKSFCLILEYVNGGNLADYFRNVPKPSTAEEVALFWKSLFPVFRGLYGIHQLILYDDKAFIGYVIHEDLKPDNILLARGPSGSPYDFTPKIADFGLYSQVRKSSKSNNSEMIGLDNSGNQQFKCCRHTYHRQKGGINIINTASDIFSMGAVLSHTSAWVTGGLPAQKEYYQARYNHHREQLPRFRSSGYEGCFHDSCEPLDIIKNVCHKTILRRCCTLDIYTSVVLELVEKYMLVGPTKDRWPAQNILEKFQEKFVADQESPPQTPSIRTPNAESPASIITTPWMDPIFSPPLASSPSTVDGLSITDGTRPDRPAKSTSFFPNMTPVFTVSTDDTAGGSTWSRLPGDVSKLTAETSFNSGTGGTTSSHGTGFSRGFRSRHEGTPAQPETQNLVNYLEHNLGGRDQLFFIDDSYTMSEHHDTIRDGFLALSCIAKRLDPNMVELAFASQPRKIYKARKTRRLRELVSTHKDYKCKPEMMQDRFSELVDHVLIPKLPYRLWGMNINPRARKRVSVYIFTDGNWGPNGRKECGVERSVQRLVEVMKERKLDRNQVSLHFVRFGDRENGKAHLKRLDSGGLVGDDWDIVDVKHIKGSVAHIMFGPLDRTNDDVPEGARDWM